MSTEDRPPGSETPTSVLAKVSETMVGVYERRFGRAPASARTHWVGGDAMACFLEDTLTSTERDLVMRGKHLAVRERRTFLQYATVAEFCEPVERLTGRTVRSFHSSIDTHVDGLSVEAFVFYPEGQEGPSRSRGDRHSLVAVEQPAGPTAGAADSAPRSDRLTAAEHASAAMAHKLMETGDLGPLIQALRDGEQGREGAREVLQVMVELDPDQLVQVALDTLMDEHFSD